MRYRKAAPRSLRTRSTPTVCAPADGFVDDADDCDDNNDTIHPGAGERCDDDDIDEDCDGLVNDDDPSVTGGETYYTDADGDGYGDAGAPISACSAPSGASTRDDDCDDDEASAHPGGLGPTDFLDRQP